MTPLPSALGGGGEVVVWRLDKEIYAPTWQTGEGAYRAGGRWSTAGHRVVYCALDPATAILEVAVHAGFKVLDTVAHNMVRATVPDLTSVHRVKPEDVPNPNWLRPGDPSVYQQGFGDDLLKKHGVVVIPSVVSTNSWNMIFTDTEAAKLIDIKQERFALDTRFVKRP